MDPTSLALNVSEKALVDFARRYGFAGVRASEALSKACPPELALEAAKPAFEALASLLSSACGLSPTQARLLCGLRGRSSLLLTHPSELPGDVLALFSPESATVKISGVAREELPAGAHLGHEWAHALDFALGRDLPPAPSKSVGMARFSGIGDVVRASEGAAPYQGMLGALASGLSEGQRPHDRYASLLVADGAPTGLPAFGFLIKALLPGMAKSMHSAQRRARTAEGEMQMSRLGEFAANSAYECLSCDAEVAAAGISTETLLKASRFCAKTLLESSRRESVLRRGRESAIDEAKGHIRAMLRGALRLPEAASERLTSEIFHIAPLKERIGDSFYAAPYTGRSHWEGPASLADLSCALVRVSRNQRALSNSKLAKEKFVPMAFWWSMRRLVSQHASDLGTRAERVMRHLADSGRIPESVLEHAKQWGGERGDYKAGALVFSDLVGTGSKMIQQEAEMAGRDLGAKEARALRRRIAAPIDEIARRDAVKESFAESFEQFVAHQAGFGSAIGRACRKALEARLVESDPLEVAASLDPSSSWMHGKDADPAANARRWRTLLRELSASSSLNAPARRARVAAG